MTPTDSATEPLGGVPPNAADPPRIEPNTPPHSRPYSRPRAQPSDSRPSIVGLLGDLLRELPGVLSDRVHLLALELKRARQALIGLAAMFAVTAILALTAWFALWVLLVALAMRFDVPWDIACIFVLLINLIGAWLAVRHARKLAGYMALPATMRQLSSAPARAAEAAGRARAELKAEKVEQADKSEAAETANSRPRSEPPAASEG
ncbi:MAG: phage holin family protein [Propionivibrio sp.]